MNIETYLHQFEKEYRNRFEVGTLKLYRSSIKTFLLFQKKGIEELSKKDIREWLNYLSVEKGYMSSTLNNKIAALKHFFCFCKEEGFVEQDPSLDINFVKVEEKLPYYLSNQELTQLREFLNGKILERAIMEVLYTTGVRISELILMQKSDINWNDRYISIPEGKRKVGRIALFTLECAEHLKVYLDSRTDDLPDVFVLYNTKGAVTKHPNVVEEWFRYYKRSLGVKMTPHTMRHTFAAHLAQKGMPLAYIQVLLGHEGIQTTQIYAKLYDHARKEIYDDYM